MRDAGYAVSHSDPRTIEQIYAWVRALGALFDRTKEAEALVLKMQQGFNDVKRKASLLPRRPKLYIEEWHDPPYVSGNWVPEIARIAGGEAFDCAQGRQSSLEGQLSCVVTFEEVERWNPDLIVISWCGAGALAPKELLLHRPHWDALGAVQQRQVRVIDDSLLNRPGPRLVEGAQRLYGWMFEKLH